jgi:uncharacterized protein (TIGR01777 family)
MRVLITGATGQIGRRLVLDRLQRGDEVVVVSRRADEAERLFAARVNPSVTVVSGNPAAPGPWQRAVDSCDAIVHLAGAGVADRRWTPAYKKLIATSRIDSTHQVVNAIESASRRPSVLVSGSAVGYYGDTAGQEVDESSPPSADFFGELCTRWEQQALRARDLGVRVVLLRTGVVLDERGGMLAKMSPLFRWFLGGPIGSGRHYVSWIHWRDHIGIIDLALRHAALSGPLNATAPEPVTNRRLSRAIGRSLHRPAALPIPPLALRMVMGEIAANITASQRVIPAKAIAHRYRFLYSDIDAAVESLLGEAQRDDESNDQAESSSADHALQPAEDQSAPASFSGPGTEAPTRESKRLAAPGAPVKLLAIDVDGVLLRSDQTLAQGVIDACRAAERSGCAVVLATARSPATMQSIVQTLGITAPTINYHGALIWNPIQHLPQYHEPLDVATVREIIALARSVLPESRIALESLDHWYTDRQETAIGDGVQQQLDPDQVGPLETFLDRPVSRLSLIAGPAEGLERLMEQLRELYWKTRRIAIFQTSPRLVQVTHPRVDKGVALQRIAKRLSIPRERVMAIGDAPNDLGMLEWAGFAVAVDNAWPAVKQLADVVVPSNDDHGVARAIQRYVLSRS